MAHKHRRRSKRSKKIALIGAATATALTVSAVSPPTPATPEKTTRRDVALTAGVGDIISGAVNVIGGHNGSTPGGSGGGPGTVDNTGLRGALSGITGGLGLDGMADQILSPVLGSTPGNDSLLRLVDPSVLTNALGGLDIGGLLGLPNIGDLLGGLLPGGIGSADSPINIITTGPPFGLLGILGLNPFWVPALPNLIANDINTTPYLLGLRIPVVIGFGLGSFATGLAYPAVVDNLTAQPDGITILPMVLLRNPGRANGGLFARFDPLTEIFGINTVTRDVSIEHRSGGLLGKTLIPFKLDATVEYDTLSDFPAWPNPVSLVNSAAAFIFPTYILRGSSLDGLGGQLLNPLVSALGGLLSGNPDVLNPLLNPYVTIHQNSLPILEPLRLPIDFLNLFAGCTLSNPFADAIEPALKILVNLGYTDVTQNMGNPLDPYPRTLLQAGQGADTGAGVPFGTLPNVNWGQVPGDVITALEAGFTHAFLNGGIPGFNPAGGIANPLTGLLDFIGNPLSGLDLGGLNLAELDPSQVIALVNSLTGGLLGGVTGGGGTSGGSSLLPNTSQSQRSANVTALSANETTDDHSAARADNKVLGDNANDNNGHRQSPVKPADKTPLRNGGDTSQGATESVDTSSTTVPQRHEETAKRAQERTDAAANRAQQRLDKIAKDGQDQINKIVGKPDAANKANKEGGNPKEGGSAKEGVNPKNGGKSNDSAKSKPSKQERVKSSTSQG